MHRGYTTTFLGITADDIEDFVTLRRYFDKPLQHRLSIDYETELKTREEKYTHLITEKEIIEKQIKEIRQSKSFNQIIDQSEKILPFPYQSFRNLRHWRKAPKTLKIFFQALACLFSISKHDFLTELKVNHNLFRNQSSTAAMDEFRMKYFNLIEVSPQYIRTKSLDAYLIALWMHNIEENERLNRIRQPQIENRKQLEKQLIQLNTNLLNKQKEIQLTEDKIKTLKKNIDQMSRIVSI